MARLPPPSNAVARDALVDALAQTAYAVSAVLTRTAAAHDLSLTQLRVIAILRGRRLRMSELADHLGLERSSLSGLIDRAQQRGLVERVTAAGDGRVVEVQLTRSGVALATRVTADAARELGPFTETLSKPEARQLQVLLQRVLAASRA